MTVIPLYYGTAAWEILHGGFWAALCNHLIGQPEARAAFKRDTGMSLDALIPRSPMEALIDNATGHREAVLGAWCDWVTKNHWGEAPNACVSDGPDDAHKSQSSAKGPFAARNG